MTIAFPALKEIVERTQTDVQNELDESNPFLRQSYIRALIVGYSGRIEDLYKELQELLKQMFPDTATGTFLRRWGSYVNVNPNPATSATGNITITGNAGTVVPINTLFFVNELQYHSTVSKTLASNTINISSITRIGTTATATTESAHELASSIQVTIAGALQSEYNGLKTITVISDTQFSFTVSGSPTTPATGTITAQYTGVTINLISDGLGSDYNQTSGTPFVVTPPISGASLTAYAQISGISGGTDAESDDDYALRVIERYRNPVTPFNKAQITALAKQVSGVTRVFIEEATPFPGQVTIYFMRDNDDNPIPTPDEIQTVKEKILTIKPAHTEDNDVIVLAPTAVTVNFTFTALVPNTTTMQTAIANNLAELFAEGTEVGSNLVQDAYRGTIFQTVDTETGQVVKSYTLSTPTTDITISSGQIPVLGTVTFPEV